ncbi:MAG: hypothetical protein Q6K99_05160 [Thermostichales cyanobacterium BF4_bins_65]
MKIDLLASVRSVVQQVNWDNQTQPPLSWAGIPTAVVLREWSVGQFFRAMPWQLVGDGGVEEEKVYQEDPMLTLASFADLF